MFRGVIHNVNLLWSLFKYYHVQQLAYPKMHHIIPPSPETLTSLDHISIILLDSLDKNERTIRESVQKYL